MKIKDRIKKKLNVFSEEEDISSLKFSCNTFNQLLKNADVNLYSDFIEVTCTTERNALKFNAQNSEKYKLNLVHAFAKVFDFESDVFITNDQKDVLQNFINEFVKENQIEKKKVSDVFKPKFMGSAQQNRLTV